MNEAHFQWIIVAAAIGISLLVYMVRRSSPLYERLLHLATTWGWEAPSKVWWNGAIRGRWRGYAVELRHMNRYKSVPERVMQKVRAGFPGRVILRRRTEGFLSKPVMLFGPSFVEPMSFADRDKYWIRSNEQMFADRLAAQGGFAAALEPNLIARFDVVDLRAGELRILRAVDAHEVKKRFDRPAFQLKRDVELIETVAGEEWRLGSLVVDAVGTPAGG